MAATVTCACGEEFTHSHEEELVRLFQEHARTQHGMEVPREKILEIAHERPA